jgi:hypothetical protein
MMRKPLPRIQGKPGQVKTDETDCTDRSHLTANAN